MSNDYFRYSANILPGGVARSQPITQTFEAIARAFELIPNPIADGVNRGFSQSVQVGPAQQNNQAVTLGQMLEALEQYAGSEYDTETVRQLMLQAQSARDDAAQSYHATESLFDGLGAAFSNLGIGTSVMDAQGNVILTYNGESITNAYINADGDFVVETLNNQASSDWPYEATVFSGTSAPLYIPNTGLDAGVYVDPQTTAHVEYTLSSQAKIEANTATWVVWPLGNVSQPTDDAVSTTVTALRLVSTDSTYWQVTL